MSSFFRYFLFPAWFVAAAFLGLSCDSQEFDNTKNFYQPHHGGGHDTHAENDAHGEGSGDASHGADHSEDSHGETGDHADGHAKDEKKGHPHPNVIPQELD